MFERFTESARRTLFFARYEASQQGSVAVETEHLLRALIRAETPPVSEILKHFRVFSPDLLRSVDARTHFRDRIPDSVAIPFTEETQRVLNWAREEADGLRNAHIGREHLFLGLLREDASLAASILAEPGITLEATREYIGTQVTAQPCAGETATAEEWLEVIRALADQLGHSEVASTEVRSVVEQIHRAIDAVKSCLGSEG
jgi:ATP-dependent Clp protease ATP-binding subunit ClpC